MRRAQRRVVYLEAFFVDSLLMGCRVNLSYIMLNHMIAYCENMTRVLPYGHFLTKVFKEFGLDLSTEIESDNVKPGKIKHFQKW